MKVLIVDDHAIFRQGLRQIMSGISLVGSVGEAGTASEAMRMVRNGEWDLALLDIALPDRSGLELLKQIRNEKPKLPVLMLSMYAEDQYAVRAVRAGAAGYLTKESAPDELVNAVSRVVAGGKYITATLAEKLACVLDHSTGELPHESLSNREFQVFSLLAAGHTASEIAEELSLSIKTVSTYRTRIREKMGMKHNVELAHYAFRHGLIE